MISLYTGLALRADQLRILRAEVGDEDGTLGGLGLSGHRVPSVAGMVGAASDALTLREVGLDLRGRREPP